MTGLTAYPPSHLGIAEQVHVPSDPDEFAVVRVAGNIGIAEGDVNRIRGDRRSVHGQVGLLVSSLVDTQPEVVPPQFLAGVSIEAECQQ